MRWWLASGLVVLAACGAVGPGSADAGPGFDWRLPKGFPTPTVPADNPMTAEKVELGRRLFYDVRLSKNRTQACASCHEQRRAFTDGRPVGIGSTGEAHPRNAQGLANVAYVPTLTWANPLLTTLERQALLPLLGEHPVELGFAGAETELFERLATEADYAERFERAFPDESPAISLVTITRALAAFQRTLLSGNSPYDRWVNGDASALSESAKRGLELFNSEALECYHCHAGFNFSDSVSHAGTAAPETPFHNTGLYNLDGNGAYPAGNTGLFDITGRPGDMGRFRAPSLRNLTVTAPYMHDGSIATLRDVITHYAQGGRSKRMTGALSPLQSDLVRGFTLSAQETDDLLAFLEALTDDEFLSNPSFSSPFGAGP
ncbi:MAG: di-heme enzyme [Myxococcaceae bacterium]|jgi:cytochrome c peroxidase|nr:di-heme enzyme [Myxococcaceae bacterium]